MMMTIDDPGDRHVLPHEGTSVSYYSWSGEQTRFSDLMALRQSRCPTPSFPSEIFGMFIEALGGDQHSLRACSIVSSVFRHLCAPILYRDIELDREEKVSTFILLGEHSDILQYVKSLSVTNPKDPYEILDTISRKASLKTLCLHRTTFFLETLTASLLSRLSTVTVLVLQGCYFEEFEVFVSFIRCFPFCEVLRLRSCSWSHHDDAKLELPIYDIAPAHLEVTNNFEPAWGEDYCDQGKIFGAPWLGLAGLKSFTYAIGGERGAEPVLEKIAACEMLEEIDMALSHSVRRSFGERDPSSRLSDSEHVGLAEISDYPFNATRHSYQVPHHQVRLWTHSLMDALSR